MLSVGLTGGIGSGKSLVTKIFNYNWNIPVYYADDRAKWLMQNDSDLIAKTINLLGFEAYRNGQINKELIASKIFSDKEIKQKLESFVHQAVMSDYKEWQKHQTSQYVIHEAALIFESNLQKNFDKIITVVCPFELRLKRLANKGIDNDEAQRRINAQTNDFYKSKRSDYVLLNDERSSLLEQIIHIHKLIIYQ